MPRKIRELKARLLREGFQCRSGKGSHTVWEHVAAATATVTLSGNDGDDAKPYQQRQVDRAIAIVKRTS